MNRKPDQRDLEIFLGDPYNYRMKSHYKTFLLNFISVLEVSMCGIDLSGYCIFSANVI